MRNVIFASGLALSGVAAGVWQRVIRRSGVLEAHAPYLVDETGQPSRHGVRVTAMGTTMFLVDDGDTQVLIDPFLTPVPLWAAATNRPVATASGVVDAALNRVQANRVEAVLVSHSHHDHALDLAHVAHRTGAAVHGSVSTLNIARGGDVSEDYLHMLDVSTRIDIGQISVQVIASRHSPNPLGGEHATIDAPLRQPVGIKAYTEGGTYDFLISAGGQQMLFKNSAHWIPGALDNLEVDVLFLGVGGLGKADDAFVDGYLQATIGTLRPHTVVPTHWNDLFAPVRPHLPLQRKLIDLAPTSLNRTHAKATEVEARFVILDAFATLNV